MVDLILVIFVILTHFFFHTSKLTRIRTELKSVSESRQRSKTCKWRNICFHLLHMSFSIVIISFFKRFLKTRLLIERRMSSESIRSSSPRWNLFRFTNVLQWHLTQLSTVRVGVLFKLIRNNQHFVWIGDFASDSSQIETHA